jgi:hypothetical protein
MRLLWPSPMQRMSVVGDIAEAWLMYAAAEDVAASRRLLKMAVLCRKC